MEKMKRAGNGGVKKGVKSLKNEGSKSQKFVKERQQVGSTGASVPLLKLKTTWPIYVGPDMMEFEKVNRFGWMLPPPFLEDKTRISNPFTNYQIYPYSNSVLFFILDKYPNSDR